MIIIHKKVYKGIGLQTITIMSDSTKGSLQLPFVISTENEAKAEWEWRNPLMQWYCLTVRVSTKGLLPLCHSERRLTQSVVVEESPKNKYSFIIILFIRFNSFKEILDAKLYCDSRFTALRFRNDSLRSLIGQNDKRELETPFCADAHNNYSRGMHYAPAIR